LFLVIEFQLKNRVNRNLALPRSAWIYPLKIKFQPSTLMRKLISSKTIFEMKPDL